MELKSTLFFSHLNKMSRMMVLSFCCVWMILNAVMISTFTGTLAWVSSTIFSILCKNHGNFSNQAEFSTAPVLRILSEDMVNLFSNNYAICLWDTTYCWLLLSMKEVFVPKQRNASTLFCLPIFSCRLHSTTFISSASPHK